ncbi:MAG: MoaD/ThiS family protein [Phycisphaeraceae bacterium]
MRLRLDPAMPHVTITHNLQRHVTAPEDDVEGATIRAVLDQYFARHPAVRGYLLDEHDRLRQHVVIFADGRMISDRANLSDPLAPDSEVYVMQALSGG